MRNYGPGEYKHEENKPYSLRSEDEIKKRLARLYLPHIKPLTQYVEKIRKQTRKDKIPYFDPSDGGIRAKIMFLLEAPGKKAVSSCFVSMNNPDPTARNLCKLIRDADILRKDIVIWNSVPWYVGDEHKIAEVGETDIDDSIYYLEALIKKLIDLRIIVLMGNKAQTIMSKINRKKTLTIRNTCHPSLRVFNRWPEKKQHTLDVLKEVTEMLA